MSLVPVLTPLYLYVSTFRSMCAVPNMAVICSSLTSWFPGMLLMYFLDNFEMLYVFFWVITRRLNFSCRRFGITQKKTHNILNTAKVCNQENFEMVPVAPIITGIVFVFTFHMRCISIVRSLYFRIFSVFFLITFLFIIIIIIIIIINCKWVYTPVAVCYNAKRDNTKKKHNKYNNTHHTNNIQHSNLQTWPRALHECATHGMPNIRALLYE